MIIIIINLQALTIDDQNNILLIESEIIYLLPANNLNTSSDSFLLMMMTDTDTDNQNLQISPFVKLSNYHFHWYDLKKFKLLDHYQNNPEKLLWFTYLILYSVIGSDINNNNTMKQKYRFYQMKDTYYILIDFDEKNHNNYINNDKKTINDHYDPKVYPLDFTIVSNIQTNNFFNNINNNDYDDGNCGGSDDVYIFGHHIMNNLLYSTNKRVIITRLVIKEVVKYYNNKKLKQLKINLPFLCSVDNQQFPTKGLYYYMETDMNRTRIFLRSPSYQPQRLNYREDFFIMPPAGLMMIDFATTNSLYNKMYLLDRQLKRVYVLNGSEINQAFQLSPLSIIEKDQQQKTIELQILNAKSWSSFFRCNDENDPGEPTQEKYIEIVESILMYDKQMYPGGKIWWQIGFIFLGSLLTIIVLYNFFFLFKKQQNHEQKRGINKYIKAIISK